MSILQRNDADDVKIIDIDKNQVNKWRWPWLEKSVVVDPSEVVPKAQWTKGKLTLVLKDAIRKVDVAGKACCIVCGNSRLINYGTTGVKAITVHMKSKDHIRKVIESLENNRLPGATDPVPDAMYGVCPVYSDAAPPRAVPPKPSVHILDRVANFEAMLVAFIAEHSLPFSIAEDLLVLCRELAKDPLALKRLKMTRTTASYKLVHGLAKNMQDELIGKLKTTPFAMNMDESTSTNVKHVYTLLVSYFDPLLKDVKVEHLGSVDVPSCTSENLYDETKKLFETNQIPWKNLMSTLCDSASTMRGAHNGLETKLRTNLAQHLLDIDGESCHHIHNVVKEFTSHFSQFLEGMLRDISAEYKYCADSLDSLKEMCFHLEIDFRKPDDFIAARWLSVYDISIEFHHMLDAHKMIFYAFQKADVEIKLNRCKKLLKSDNLPGKADDNDVFGAKSKKELEEERRNLLKEDAKRKKAETSVLKKHKTSELSKAAISDLTKGLSRKFKTGTTKKGRERKQRVIKKLHQSNYYTMITSLYHTIMPLFKRYVMLFQSDRPLIHKIYYKEVEIVRTFFSYFVKPDVLVKCKNGHQLLRLEMKSENLLPKELMFVGVTASKLIDKLGKTHSDVVKFLDNTASAYLSCGRYIQKKLPLENNVLKTFSSIDPLFVTSPNKLVLERLVSLPKILTNILGDEEEALYQEQVRSLLVDGQLPVALDDSGEEVDCVKWWLSVSPKYPVVFKMVIAVLSNFHGPRVESSFSVMGDVLDKKSGRMNMSTYSAIQTVKYGLKARQPLTKHMAVGNFSRGDKLYSPVNEKLSNNMRGAFTSYKQELVQKKEEKKAREKLYEIEKESKTTRKKLKEDNAASAEAAYLAHQEILDVAYKPKRKLPLLVNETSSPKKKKQSVKDSTQDNEKISSDDEASTLIVVKDVSPKRKKQSNMFTFLVKSKSKNLGGGSNKESEDVDGADFERSSCDENRLTLKESNSVDKLKKKGESSKENGNGKGRKKNGKKDPKQKNKQTKSSLSHKFRTSHVESTVDSYDEVIVPRLTYRFNDSSEEESNS